MGSIGSTMRGAAAAVAAAMCCVVCVTSVETMEAAYSPLLPSQMTRDADVLERQQSKSIHRITQELSRYDNSMRVIKADASASADAALRRSVEQQVGNAEAQLEKTRRDVNAKVAKAKAQEQAGTVSVENTPDETRQREEHHEAIVELEKLLVHARALVSDVPTN